MKIKYERVNANEWNQIAGLMEEDILQYDDVSSQQKFFLKNNREVVSLLQFEKSDHIFHMTLWCKYFHKNIADALHEFISAQLRHNEYVKISIQLFGYQMKYISFLKGLGFVIEAVLRHHFSYHGIRQDIVILSIDNKEVSEWSR